MISQMQMNWMHMQTDQTKTPTPWYIIFIYPTLSILLKLQFNPSSCTPPMDKLKSDERTCKSKSQDLTSRTQADKTFTNKFSDWHSAKFMAMQSKITHLHPIILKNEFKSARHDQLFVYRSSPDATYQK